MNTKTKPKPWEHCMPALPPCVDGVWLHWRGAPMPVGYKTDNGLWKWTGSAWKPTGRPAGGWS